MPPFSSLFFAFSTSSKPSYLHSFPTRRSSDLSTILNPVLSLLFDFTSAQTALVSLSALGEAKSVRTDRKSTRLNSQSHVNLVCRLLLEKKKYVRMGGAACRLWG